jgi:hypothetical protein
MIAGQPLRPRSMRRGVRHAPPSATRCCAPRGG